MVSIVSEWIAITERHPENTDNVLVFSNVGLGHIEIGYWSAADGYFATIDGAMFGDEIPSVTHWMPLPEAPKVN